MPPFVVLDANVLRDQKIVEASIARFLRDGASVAVPEIVLFELTKHPERWESTLRASLGPLARCPHAVVLTRSSKPLGLTEEATGSPTRSFEATALTSALQALLRDIAAGDGSSLHAFREAVERERGHVDHEGHAQNSLLSMQALTRLVPRELVLGIGKDLAQGDRDSFRAFVRENLSIREQRNAHVRRGVGETAADALLAAPSVSYLFALAVGAVALEWVIRGGVDGARPTRVANDVLDIDYILAGLWVGRLISKDAGVRARFEDIQALGSAAWPDHEPWFKRAVAVGPDEALGSFLAV